MTAEGGDFASCTCGRLCVGSTVTEHRNWNPDCDEHGTASAWWKSPEQVAKREAQNARSRDLQRQAREARAAARTAASHEAARLRRWAVLPPGPGSTSAWRASWPTTSTWPGPR